MGDCTIHKRRTYRRFAWAGLLVLASCNLLESDTSVSTRSLSFSALLRGQAQAWPDTTQYVEISLRSLVGRPFMDRRVLHWAGGSTVFRGVPADARIEVNMRGFDAVITGSDTTFLYRWAGRDTVEPGSGREATLAVAMQVDQPDPPSVSFRRLPNGTVVLELSGAVPPGMWIAYTLDGPDPRLGGAAVQALNPPQSGTVMPSMGVLRWTWVMQTAVAQLKTEVEWRSMEDVPADTTPPPVRLAPIARFAPTDSLVHHAWRDSVLELRVVVRGPRPTTVVVNPSSSTPVTATSPFGDSVWMASVSLVEGVNQLSVRADWDDSVRSVRWTVVRGTPPPNTPPWIEWIVPVDRFVYSGWMMDSVNVSFRVLDTTGVIARVILDNFPVVIGADGRVDARLRADRGRRVLRVLAIDQGNLVAQDSVVIVRDSVAPDTLAPQIVRLLPMGALHLLPVDRDVGTVTWSIPDSSDLGAGDPRLSLIKDSTRVFTLQRGQHGRWVGQIPVGMSDTVGVVFSVRDTVGNLAADTVVFLRGLDAEAPQVRRMAPVESVHVATEGSLQTQWQISDDHGLRSLHWTPNADASAPVWRLLPLNSIQRGQLSLNVDLAVQPRRIQVRAVDSLGAIGQASLVAWLQSRDTTDTVPPILTRPVDAPDTLAPHQGDSVVTLQVMARDEHSGVAEVWANSRDLLTPIQNLQNLWEGRIVLGPDDSLIRIVAMDSAGNASTPLVWPVRRLRLDTTGPVLSLVFPSTDSVLPWASANVQVIITAVDPSGTDSVGLNGLPMTRDNSHPSTGGGSRWTGIATLSPGYNNLVVRALDGRGNVTEQVWAVRRNALPQISTILEPVDRSIDGFDSIITAMWEITDDEQVDPSNVVVEGLPPGSFQIIPDTPIPNSTQITASFPLSPSEVRTVRVRFRDARGDSAVLNRTFRHQLGFNRYLVTHLPSPGNYMGQWSSESQSSQLMVQTSGDERAIESYAPPPSKMEVWARPGSGAVFDANGHPLMGAIQGDSLIITTSNPTWGFQTKHPRLHPGFLTTATWRLPDISEPLDFEKEWLDATDLRPHPQVWTRATGVHPTTLKAIRSGFPLEGTASLSWSFSQDVQNVSGAYELWISPVRMLIPESGDATPSLVASGPGLESLQFYMNLRNFYNTILGSITQNLGPGGSLSLEVAVIPEALLGNELVLDSMPFWPVLLDSQMIHTEDPITGLMNFHVQHLKVRTWTQTETLRSQNVQDAPENIRSMVRERTAFVVFRLRMTTEIALGASSLPRFDLTSTPLLLDQIRWIRPQGN